MQGDLISRDFTVKALREYAEQKHAVGQTELANGILKAINFLQKEQNVPTAYDVEKVDSEVNEIAGRIFNYCEEIDNNIPEEERTGYDMLLDIQRLRECVRNGGKE